MTSEFLIDFPKIVSFAPAADDNDTGIGICGWILTALCWLLVVVTMPFSFCVCFKVSAHPIRVHKVPDLLKKK